MATTISRAININYYSCLEILCEQMDKATTAVVGLTVAKSSPQNTKLWQRSNPFFHAEVEMLKKEPKEVRAIILGVSLFTESQKGAVSAALSIWRQIQSQVKPHSDKNRSTKQQQTEESS